MHKRTSLVVHYVFAILVVLFATVLHFGLIDRLGEGVPFILYFPAVVVCAWFGGLWPGLFSTGLGAAIAWYLFIPPAYSFALSDPVGAGRLMAFLFACVLISFLAESLHRARKRAEASERMEREQRERFHVTLASIGDAVIATDVGGTVTFMNSAAESLTGWTREGAEGKTLDEIYTIQDAPMREVGIGVAPGSPATESDREAVPRQPLLVRRDETTIPIEENRTPIVDPEGRPLGSVLIIRDVAERARTQLELHDSRERLRLAMEAGEMGTWTRELDASNQVEWSPELEKIFGLEPGEFPGTEEAFFDLVHPEDRGRLHRAVAEAIETRTEYEIEFRYMRKGGREGWMIGRGGAFYDAAGRPFRLAGIGWDITARKRAEERFRLAVEAAPNSFVMVRGEGTIVMVNGQAEELFGYAREELIGQPVEMLIPQSLRSRHSDDRANFLAAPSRRAMGSGRDLYGLRKDGIQVPIEIGLNPIEIDDEIFILSSIVDISERKRAERERADLLEREQAARAEAEAANKAKDSFFATVSHELRSPLAAILGCAGILERGDPDPDATRLAIETIGLSARAQAKLIDDLLDISRIISGKMRIAFDSVDLVSVIEIALETVRPAARAKGIRLEVEIDAGEHFVMGDAFRMQQVLWNLFSNAVKFTPKEGNVRIRLESTDSDARIRIRDTGIGIAPDLLPHVFERFKQADQTRTHEHAGLGLGLAIARELVEMHGGIITAESSGQGAGATFTVTLPRRPASADVSEETVNVGA